MDLLKRPVNLRDLGGYKGLDGKRVKELALLRSGEVTDITKSDEVILLDEYKLKTIVDFRSEAEKSHAPDSLLSDVEYYHIDIMKSAVENNTTMENFKHLMKVDMITKFMKESYREFITSDSSIKGYREFFDLLLKQEEGSLLFHCFAGKDRTGFGAALIYTVLGVSKEDIFHDYLLTNKLRAKENKRLIEHMSESGLTEEEKNAMEIALNVDSEYLDTAYKTAEEVYGSLENYIREALKLDLEEQSHMIEKYLV